MPHLTLHDSQLDLARYLQFEMHARQDTLRTLCQVLNTEPDPLKMLLAGHLLLSAEWAMRLGQHWEISPGLLWHWQQDILAVQSGPDEIHPAQASD